MINFKKKRALLIAPKFFSYDYEIAKQLELQGLNVDLIADRPFSSPIMKAAIRYASFLFARVSDAHYIGYAKKNIEKNYDYIFVIQGESLTCNSLSFLKKLFPNAKLVLYLWDSLRNKKKLQKLLICYDKVFTFDPQDAINYGLVYRPLFFIPSPITSHKRRFLYIASFIGTCHSDRYLFFKNFEFNIKNYGNVFLYKYLQAGFVYWVYKLFNPAFRKAKFRDFKYRPLSLDRVNEIRENSFSLIDVEHPNQVGLTMRTFEALGSSKKLITTNKNIANESFYNPHNIFIIDRSGALIPDKSFFSTPFQAMPKSFETKYSIEGWISDIFGNLKS